MESVKGHFVVLWKKMSLPNMRISKNRQEYIENMGLIFLEESEAFIWQNIEGFHKTAAILIKDILPQQNSLVISPREKTFPLQFNSKRELYFKAKRKEMLFKSLPGEYEIRPHEASLLFPKKIFYLEMRQTPRLTSLTGEVFIHLERLQSMQKNGEFKGKIRDISTGGVGFITSFKEHHLFEMNSLFKIDKIGHTVFKKFIVAKVVYNTLIKINQQDEFSFFIGLKFKEKLAEEILTPFASPAI